MRLTILLLAAVVASGCFRHHFKTDLPPGPTVHETGAWFLLWGLVPGHDVDLDQHCPQGVAEFGNHMGFGGFLLETLTLGLVAHRSISITCAAPDAAATGAGAP